MRVARMARRVGSARAPKVESSVAEYLTIWFSIDEGRGHVKRNGERKALTKERYRRSGFLRRGRPKRRRSSPLRGSHGLFRMGECGQELFAGGGTGSERKKIGEMVGETRFYFIEGHAARKELLEGGSFAAHDAAGNDEVEIAQVGRDVIGEAVRRDPAADVDADRSKFFFLVSGFHPDAGPPGDAVGGNAEIGAGADHNFFERSNVPADIAPEMGKIQDGVTDDLAGAVIGDVSATVRFVEFHGLLAQDGFGGEQIRAIGIAAECDDVRMLAEQEDVVDGAGFASGNKTLLQGEGLAVGDEAQVGDEASRHNETVGARAV